MSEVSPSSGPRRTLAVALNPDRLYVYGEPAFHYFLNIERERSCRSDRPCVLVRLDLKSRGGRPKRIPQSISERLFVALAQSVRETDFLGWYRDRQVAGVVLTELGGESQGDGIRRVIERIRRTVDSQLAVEVSSRLDIRVTAVRDESAWS
jgi:hypothetical protein